jgi:uncharacterized protein
VFSGIQSARLKKKTAKSRMRSVTAVETQDLASQIAPQLRLKAVITSENEKFHQIFYYFCLNIYLELSNKNIIMFQRDSLEIIKRRMLEPRKFIQVITGPRQVGKTTLMKQFIEGTGTLTHFVTADNVYAADSAWIQKAFSNARLKLKQSGAPELILIIDEVQKVSKWSEAIKKEWDADTFNDVAIKLILLGSSRLLLQQGLTESLAGRFELMHVTHWSFSEMKTAFGWDVNTYIYFGGYPGAAHLIGEEERWRDYVRESLVETTISRDILMLTRVDKPALLKRLFEIGCKYSSQILSLNKVQGELQETGNLTTLANYLTLLSEAGLLTGLEKYSPELIRKRASKPKFQVYNNALLSAGSDTSRKITEAEPKLWGRFAESAVGSHLVNMALKYRFNVYYWNNGMYEVDYVIERNGKVAALEVKSGADGFSKGLSIFNESYHPSSILTIGTSGIPTGDFLEMNPLDLL